MGENKYTIRTRDLVRYGNTLGVCHSEYEAWLSIDRDIREWMKTDNCNLDDMALSTYYRIYKHDANSNKHLDSKVDNGYLCINFKPSVNFVSYLDLINGVRKLKIKHILDN